MIQSLLFALALLHAAPATEGRSSKALFKEALQTYTTAKSVEDYKRAADLFNTLVERNISHEDLYYNLGNAYYQAGQYGYAVFNYERALKLHPSHSKARYNLKLTRNLIKSRFKDSVVSFGENPFWVRVVTWLERDTLRLLFFLFWIPFFGIMTWLWFRRPGLLRVGLITAAALLGTLGLVFGLLQGGRTYYDQGNRYGIVLPSEAHVREAPQKTANTAFTLHEGIRVRLGSEERAWIKISLPNGMEGWVEKAKVGRL